MPLELVEDALGDCRNATFLATASELAYLPEAEGKVAFREQLGLDASLISVDNTQVYVAHNDNHIVVAFRGTEAPTSIDGLKDWLLADAMNLLVVPEGRLGTDFAAAGVGARFHKGFMGAIAQVWDPVYTAVEAEMKRKERPLWITGHSLGGALALLAAWLFQRRMISVHQVYTYGGPMIGNAEASQAFDREFPNKIYRYVNTDDPVPRLPTISLLANDYVHCMREMGARVSGDPATALAFFSALVGQTIEGVLNRTIIDDIWASVTKRIEAHGLTAYRVLIGEPPQQEPK